MPHRKFIAAFLLAAAGWQKAQAEPPAAAANGSAGQKAPAVCVGYDPQQQRWGTSWVWEFRDHQYACPPGYAMFEVEDPTGKNSPPRNVRLLGNCCPLPDSDILSNHISFEPEECPDNYIATGFSYRDWNCEDCDYLIRCQKINTRRYQLGPARPGLYWGFGSSGSFARFFKTARVLKRSDIPAAIRPAVGRRGKTQWDTDGCIGDPPGSILTAKRSKTCNGFYFRELQYAGQPGDPPTGAPVVMFPECDKIADVFDPHSRCSNGGSD